MSDENEDKTPEGLDDFIKNIFGNKEKAEEFAAELEDPMVEAWQGIHEIYAGLRSGGFSTYAACDVIAGYMYRMITGMGNGEAG